MDYKVKVAQVIEQAVDGKLSQEDILAKIEKPKTLNLGLCISCFCIIKSIT